MEVWYEALREIKNDEEIIDKFTNETYKGRIGKLVEGGYVLEKLIFGKIVHRPPFRR